jgi:hypothetical protein
MHPNDDAAIRTSNASLKTCREETSWIWEGVIAQGAVTLLSGPMKAGKTTLLSLLLDHRHRAMPLLGRPVRPGRTIVCSEESQKLWALRQPPLDFGAELEYHRPFESVPSSEDWTGYIDHLLDLGDLEELAFDLLVVDTAMSFLPAAGNNSRGMREALDELRLVSELGAAVLLLHQFSGSRNPSRSRDPLRAFADILIDIEVPHGDRFCRRRCFESIGRYPGALERVTAELNPEGTDYVLVAEEPEQPTSLSGLETVRRILDESPEPLTRQEILDRWPESEPPLRADSLWRVLARGCELGILVRTGAGTKVEAFRYGCDKARQGLKASKVQPASL